MLTSTDEITVARLGNRRAADGWAVFGRTADLSDYLVECN